MRLYIFLGESIKAKREFTKIVVNELINLWGKINFPYIPYQGVCQKFDQILKTYRECSRRGKYESLNVVLDITKENGEWLYKKDKELFKLQIGSNVTIGYSTGIPAKASSSHSSKRIKMKYSIAVSLPRKINSETKMVSEAEDSVNWEDHSQNKSRGYNKTEKASNFVRSLNVSTKKAASIC